MSQVPRCWPRPSSSQVSCGVAGQTARREVRVGADLPAVTTGLVVAVLAGVEHVEGGQIPPPQPPVELDRVAAVRLCGPQRHVLVVRLVRRRPPSGPLRGGQRRGVVRADRARVVVLHLMVVRYDDPRRGGVRGLEIRVGLVLRVATTVVRERHDLVAQVQPRSPCRGAVLVDVVAQVQDDARVVLGHPAVDGEVALLVVRAGGEGHHQVTAGCADRGRGAGAADRREVALGAEAVEVVGVRVETTRDDVHRVGGGVLRRDRTRRDEGAEGVGGRHLPVDGDVGVRHPALTVGVQRRRCQPGPEHDAVRVGFTGRDHRAGTGTGLPRSPRSRPTGPGER